ncbi:MAG: nucleoside hydrolase, partial [Spirochaetota bacterium]
LHDALAVAAVINPAVVKTRRLYVAVETIGELTRGRTVADVHKVTGKEPNIDVALEVDTPLFVKMMREAIEVLDARCS